MTPWNECFKIGLLLLNAKVKIWDQIGLWYALNIDKGIVKITNVLRCFKKQDVKIDLKDKYVRYLWIHQWKIW